MTRGRPTSRTSILTAAALALPLAVAGCENNEQCTKARLDAADTWKAVMESAAKNKLGGAGYDELSTERKGEHFKAWSRIETEAEMVFKSFAYEKITWKTARPAREKSNSEFDGYFGRDQYKGFKTSLDAANQSFKTVDATCGD